MSTTQLIDFSITENLNQKFLTQIEKFDIRTKNILKSNDLITLGKFRLYIFNKAGESNIWLIRGTGVKTKKLFLSLFRKTIKRNMYYLAELKLHNTEFNKLPSHAKNLLIRKGIGFFEAFYYVYFVKKQPIKFEDYYIHPTRPKAKNFIKMRCKSIRSTLKKIKKLNKYELN